LLPSSLKQANIAENSALAGVGVFFATHPHPAAFVAHLSWRPAIVTGHIRQFLCFCHKIAALIIAAAEVKTDLSEFFFELVSHHLGTTRLINPGLQLGGHVINDRVPAVTAFEITEPATLENLGMLFFQLITQFALYSSSLLQLIFIKTHAG
jgi:hypothetical protein